MGPMGRPGPLELSALAKNCAADDTETSIDIVAWPWAVEGHQAPTSMFGTGADVVLDDI